MKSITKTTKKKVLELFLCSDDNRIRIIAKMTNISEVSVSNIISEYFKQRLTFERPTYFLYHSKLNQND